MPPAPTLAAPLSPTLLPSPSDCAPQRGGAISILTPGFYTSGATRIAHEQEKAGPEETRPNPQQAYMGSGIPACKIGLHNAFRGQRPHFGQTAEAASQEILPPVSESHNHIDPRKGPEMRRISSARLARRPSQG